MLNTTIRIVLPRTRSILSSAIGPVALALAVPMLLAGADAPSLNLQVSSETAPPGGWVQIKVFASAPASVSSVSISMDLDPAAFANITRVMAFSASGDAIGYAEVSALHLSAHVTSASGSIGIIPNEPILAVWTNLFVGAQPGSVAALNIDLTSTALMDPKGNRYAVTATPGQLTVEGSTWVQDVSPGGGIVGPGTVLRITGSGFDATTTLTIDGIKLGSTNLINAGEIDATVDPSTTPVEMTGRRVHITSSAGPAIDYFASLPGGVPGSSFQWILPLTTFLETTGYLGGFTHGGVSESMALLNQTSNPVTVEQFATGPNAGHTFLQQTVVIPPGTFAWGEDVGNPALGSELWVAASAPIRMALVYSFPNFISGTLNVGLGLPAATDKVPPIELLVSTNSASLSWAIGSPPPAPVQVQIGGDLPFTASVDQPWLTAIPAAGAAPATLSLVPKLAGLAPGTYSATVTITPIVPAGLPNLTAAPSIIKASLTVSAGPRISADPVNFTVNPGFLVTPNPVTTWIYTNGGPAAFTVEPPADANWLTISPLSGTAPAVLTLTADADGFGYGADFSTSVVIRGPNNTSTIPISVRDILSFPPGFPPPGRPAGLIARPASLNFILPSVPGTSQTKTIEVQPASASLQVSSQTLSGGNWLSAMFIAGAPQALAIAASTANLAAGAYSGIVTVTTQDQASSVKIGVGLEVYDPPASGTFLDASLSGSTISVASSDIPVYFSVEGASADGSLDGRISTPATLRFGASPNLPNGLYKWNVVIHWAKGDLTIPVSVTVPAATAVSPSISELLNGASLSYSYVALAPGEIMSIFGRALSTGTNGLTLDASGKVATQLNGTRVLVGGVPSPLLFVSPAQVNFVVPYEIAGPQTVPVQVVTAAGSITISPQRLASSAPGIFTANSNGYGQAAVLNQDTSANSQVNPAARGSVIQIFATGEGQTSPPGVTGSVTGNNPSMPLLPVSVTIGGVDAPVQFAGSAPYAVAGLLQVNAVVPDGAPVGARVPLVLSVGGAPSQNGVFIAVR